MLCCSMSGRGLGRRGGGRAMQRREGEVGAPGVDGRGGRGWWWVLGARWARSGRWSQGAGVRSRLRRVGDGGGRESESRGGC